MNAEKRAAERLAAMISKASVVSGTYQTSTYGGWVDNELFAEWRTQSMVVLHQILGADHQYSISFESVTNEADELDSVKRGVGVLRAASEDLAGGHLFKVRMLIEAEVFADFLEMAKHLVENGYKDPAASLAGAVLEDGLRRIANGHGVEYKRSDGIASINDLLAKAGVYNKLMQTKIDAWRQIRNAADHGKFSEYVLDDTRGMVTGVTDFLAVHLK